MTCFWNGILSRLSLDYINKSLKVRFDSKPSPKDFIISLISNSKLTLDVKWNDEQLTSKMMEENLEWVNSYKVDGIYQGHDCSICDPFLLLICQLFVVDIHHNYDGKFIIYTNSKNTNGLILSFMSDKGHFW